MNAFVKYMEQHLRIGTYSFVTSISVTWYRLFIKTIATHLLREDLDYDTFTKISFIYPHAVASIKVGQGVKSEGELIISGTKGYIYVPAPWWKTDYFEVR